LSPPLFLRLLLLLQLLVVATSHAQAGPNPASILAQRPVAYWRFGEAPGSTQALDATGHGHHGRYTGAVTLGVPGFAIDGDTAMAVGGWDGYAEVTNVPIRRSFTALVWARSATQTWGTHGWAFSARSPNGFIIHPDAGLKTVGLYILGPGDPYDATQRFRIGEVTPKSGDITEWHQYGVMYDEATGLASMIIDGAIAFQRAYTGPQRNLTAAITAWLGRDYTFCCGPRYGNGSLDEAVLFDRALTADELRGLLGGGTASVTGFVRDRNFRPIAGARVDAGNGRFALTDAQGRYTVTGLPPGSYTLRASLNGWTFGSPGFQTARYTVTVPAGVPSVWAPEDIIGWRFDPIIFVHGWTYDPSEFADLPWRFESAGYFTFAGQLDTRPWWTPPLEVNAQRVKQWIDAAKFETGRSQVILYGSSMGGLVARAYVEGGRYDSDVSQIFTYGSPHLGTPDAFNLGCVFPVVRPDAICQMTKPGMALFNLTHWQRPGTDYHLIAGNAPMLTTRRVCVRILGRNFCVVLPWPDTRFRNAAGLMMGLLIPGADDAFIQARSAAGQFGINIDRYISREVHMTRLGQRTYHEWETGFPEDGFGDCSRRVLIDGTANTCGTRMWPGPPPWLLGARREGLEKGWEPAAPELGQVTRFEQAPLLPGEQRVREVHVEGGPTAFIATWDAGTVGFTLIDPTGQSIDPASVAAQEGDPEDAEAQELSGPHPDMVAYVPSATGATYYFPAARPGTWKVVLQGGQDVPEKGTPLTLAAAFDSRLTATFESDRLFYVPGSEATLVVSLSEQVLGGEAFVTVRLSDGTVLRTRLGRSQAGEFIGRFPVPNVSGYAAVDWALTGVLADGTGFERSGREYLMVQSTALRLGNGHSDRALPRAGAPGLNAALAVSLRVNSNYVGEVGVSAELVGASGNVVAQTLTSVSAQLGDNDVELRFRAEDLYAGQEDGPYTVRNVRLLDNRGAPVLGQEVEFAHTTAAYAFRSFAPGLHTPSVLLQGPFQVAAGQSVVLTATGIDPEGDALGYAWDLDGDGVYEVSGQSVTFATASEELPRLQPVRVRVVDARGNTAEADTSVQVSASSPLPTLEW
jgi:hypothetical protein